MFWDENKSGLGRGTNIVQTSHTVIPDRHATCATFFIHRVVEAFKRIV